MSTTTLLRKFAPVLVLAALATWQGSAWASCGGIARYSGRATAVQANVTLLQSTTKVVVADTGYIDDSGATRDATVVQFDNPPPLLIDADELHAIAGGHNYVSSSDAAVQKLTISRPGLNIVADVVTAHAEAVCDPYTMTVKTSGRAQILNLRVNGIVISPGLQPNVKRSIGNISITTNEQYRPDVNTMVVNAIHIRVPATLGVAAADIVISHAEAGILTCPCI
jgi:hypothetical protein